MTPQVNHQVKLPFPPNSCITAADPSKAPVASQSPYGNFAPVSPMSANDFMAKNGMPPMAPQVPQQQAAHGAAPVQAPVMPQQMRAPQQAPMQQQAVMPPMAPQAPMAPQRAAPQMQAQPFSGHIQTQLVPVPMMPQSVFSSTYNNGFVNMPQTLKECQDFAEYVAKSELLPPTLRNRPEAVFMVIARASALGITWANAFNTFFFIQDKTGNLTIGMYVKGKAAMCATKGKWEVHVDLATGDASVTGERFDNGNQFTVTYTAYEAGLIGRLGRDANGNITGLGTWGTRWPDMMKARALGRFLDAMFPDVIGGFISKEDFDDRAYAEALEAEAAQETAKESDAAKEAAAQITKLRKGRSKSKPKADATPELESSDAPTLTPLSEMPIEDINKNDNPLA